MVAPKALSVVDCNIGGPVSALNSSLNLFLSNV